MFIHRPPDAAQSFEKNPSLRFGRKSPCDYIMYNGENLFCVELKTVAGTSISFERNNNEKGEIHYYQIEYLKKVSICPGTIAGLVIDFRKSDHTYFLNIIEWDVLLNSISKKSFNESDLLSSTHPILINKQKLRVNYRYDILRFMSDAKSSLLEIKKAIN